MRFFLLKIISAFILPATICLSQTGVTDNFANTETKASAPLLPSNSQEIDNIKAGFPVDFNNGKIQNVDIGSVVYGLEETKLLILFNSSRIHNAISAGLKGCPSCSDMQIRKFEQVDSENGIFVCEIVFNKKPALPSVSKHTRTVVIQSRDGKPLYQVNISYRVVPTTMTDPNFLSYEKIKPEEVYTITLRKKKSFDVNSLCLQDDRVLLLHWGKKEKTVELSFKVKHTFEDTKIISNIEMLTTDANEIIIPLRLNVKEYIYIEPKYLNLGLIKGGRRITRKVTIESDRELSFDGFVSDFNSVDFTVIHKSMQAKELQMEFFNKTFAWGAFKKHVKFTILPYNEIVSLPVYGVCLKN